MSKVYIVYGNKEDFALAERYGELIPLLNGPISYNKLSSYNYIIEKILKDAENEDYLLFCGPNILCAISFKAWFLSTKVSKCKILIWNKKQERYYINEVNK